MGVVIEICIKYPGGPTRITVTDIVTYPVRVPGGEGAKIQDPGEHRVGFATLAPALGVLVLGLKPGS
jgi:hypothetical protein